MTNKIFKSIISVAITILLLSLIIISTTLYHYFTTIEQNQLKDELKLIANASEQLGEDYLNQLEFENYRITWINSDGKVLFDSHADILSMENHLIREEVNEAIKYGSGNSVRHSSTLMEKTIYEALLLEDGTVIRISITEETILLLMVKMIQPITLIILLAVLISFVMAKTISNKIIEPINQLNLDSPMDNDVYEELSPLLYRIHSQQKEISKQFDKLKNKQDEINQITNNMNEALILLDHEDKILSMNPKALELFEMKKYSIGEDLFVLNRKENMRLAIKEARTSGKANFYEEIKGKTYQFELNRIDSKNHLQGLVIVAFDVSDQINAEKNRKEFTANVSHELKTPLQTIVGSVELIENQIVKQEDVPVYLNKIHKEANRMIQLIEDIIRLSQIDEGQNSKFEMISLNEISTHVYQSLKEYASIKNIDFQLSCESNIVMLGVEKLIYEIIYNLCDNAIKYNHGGGFVKLSIYEKENYLYIEVLDNGIGIEEKHHEKIFERFYRVDKSHSKKSGGTGLGLSIVKNSVKLHKGILQIESELNKGTKITIKFKKN